MTSGVGERARNRPVHATAASFQQADKGLAHARELAKPRLAQTSGEPCDSQLTTESLQEGSGPIVALTAVPSWSRRHAVP